jgi:hypothetical protein
MVKLASFLNVNLLLRLVNKKYCNGLRSKKNQYAVKSTSLESNLTLCSYLQEHPLFSSKYLNYQDFYKALMVIKNKEHKGTLGRERIDDVRANMNNNRSLFI